MLYAAASLFSKAISTFTSYRASDTQKAEKRALSSGDRKSQSIAKSSFKSTLEAPPPVAKEEKTSETKWTRVSPTRLKDDQDTSRRTDLVGQQRIYTSGRIAIKDQGTDRLNKTTGEKKYIEKNTTVINEETNTVTHDTSFLEDGDPALRNEHGKAVNRDLEFITNSSYNEVKDPKSGNTPEESFDNNTTRLAHADRTAMEKLSSRFSKFTLAVKRLGTDLVYAPLRLLNIPVQFTMSAILASQGLYRFIKPSSSKYGAQDYMKKSLVTLTQGFVSAGAATVPLVGNTIGLVTAPTFNTKHFTGGLGVRATKLLTLFGMVVTQKKNRLRFASDILGRANDPQTIHEGLKNSTRESSLKDKFQSLFITKGRQLINPGTLTEHAQAEIYKGAYFNHIAKTFNSMSLHSFKEAKLVAQYAMSPDSAVSNSYAKNKLAVENKKGRRTRAMSKKDRASREDWQRVAGTTKAEYKKLNETSQTAAKLALE